MSRKIVIVGGVAGGATCAARLRRLNESDQIIMFERGEYISFANCGLPYYVGDIIKDRDKLLVQTPKHFSARFNIDVRNFSDVVKIDREEKSVTVKDLKRGKEYKEKYDILILSPGAQPIRPPMPGIDDDRIFTLRTVPDADKIKRYVEQARPKAAVVVGGGFIGLEMAENLREQGVAVTVVEKLDQVMPNLDPEIAGIVTEHMKHKNVSFVLGAGIQGFKRGKRLIAELENGSNIECDLVILAIGVRPDTKIAIEAGLNTEKNGAIKVDSLMRTSDSAIYALGDAVWVENPLINSRWGVALAGPANRQARMVADVINGMEDKYPGTLGTSIVKIFDITVASTGCSEKCLKMNKVEYEKCYVHVGSHVSYYPGATPVTIKLIFDRKSGKIYGAEIVGTKGVDKRIDVIATAIRGGITAPELKNLELAYAPPYGAAKDPVNVAGFVAENIMSGLTNVAHWHDVAGYQKDPGRYFFLDVRTKEESELGTIEGARHIYVDELRERLSEVPRDKTIISFCQVGYRGYVAERILKQEGYEARNLSGGYKTYIQSTKVEKAFTAEADDDADIDDLVLQRGESRSSAEIELDACGLACPGPIKKTFERVSDMKVGEVLLIKASDAGFASDIRSWCEATGNTLLGVSIRDGIVEARVKKAGGRVKEAVKGGADMNEKTIVVFSGDLDRVMAAFIIATGAANMGKKVNMFFTFWGLNALRKDIVVRTKKDIFSKIFGWMMPRGAKRLKLSKLNMGGIGTAMMKHVMKKRNVEMLPELISAAQSSGVKLVACQMTMDVMGLVKDELLDGVEQGGVATFLSDTDKSNTSLFI